MTEGIRKGDKSSSYLDRLIDFPFVPPVSIINLVPSDKSSRSLRLSTFLIRFAEGGEGMTPPSSIVFRNQLDYFHPSLYHHPILEAIK